MATTKQTDKSSEKTAFEDISLKAVLQITGTVLLVIFVLKTFILDLQIVTSESMENEIKSGDFVLVSRLSYFIGLPKTLPFLGIKTNGNIKLWYNDIKRKDIVVFEKPHEENPVYYVKRVLALPGDSVKFRNDLIYVNGEETSSREWIYGSLPLTYRKILVPGKGDIIKLNNNDLFWQEEVLKNENKDFEIINGNIYINSEKRTSYLVKENYYFVVGDNRSNSSDSRDWGLLPQKYITGKPVFVYFSKNLNSNEIRFGRIGEWIN